MPIGTPFSPELVSLAVQQGEGNKDRNLKAAIADRQFKQADEDRLLSKMLGKEKLRVAESDSQRGLLGKMLGKKSAAARERSPSQVAADEALAAKRAAETKAVLTLLDPKRKDLEAKTAGRESTTAARDARTPIQIALDNARIKEAEGRTAMTAEQVKQARMSAGLMREKLQAEIRKIRAQRDKLEEGTGFDKEARADRLAALKAQVKNIDALTFKTEAQTTTEDMMREPKVRQANADIEYTGAKTESVQAKTKTEDALREGRVEALAQVLKTSKVNIENIRDQIHDRGFRRRMKVAHDHWEKAVAGAKLDIGRQRLAADLAKILVDTDPTYGHVKMDVNPELRTEVTKMLTVLIETSGGKSTRASTAAAAENARRGALRKRGAVEQDIVAPADKHGQAFLDSLNSAFPKK